MFEHKKHMHKKNWLLATFLLSSTCYSSLIYADDELPPNITIIAGQGEYYNDISSYEIEIGTDVASQCRYSISGGGTYDHMYQEFSSVDNNIHKTTYGGLYNPTETNIWAQCKSIDSNLITTQATVITATFIDRPAPIEPMIQVQKSDGSYFPANADNIQIITEWDATGYRVDFKTDVASTCKYSISGGNFGYNAFRGETSTSDGIQHIMTRSNLYKPKVQTNWLKCESTEGEIQNTTATEVEIYFGNPEQTEPPQINLVSGNGPFEIGIEQYDVILTTDISAQCRFSNSGSYSFGSLYNHFTSSEDGLTHTHSSSGSYNGSDKTLWAQCRGSENGLSTINALEITTTFGDVTPANQLPVCEQTLTPSFYVNSGTHNLSEFISCIDADQDPITFENINIDSTDKTTGNFQQLVKVSDGKETIDVSINYLLIDQANRAPVCQQNETPRYTVDSGMQNLSTSLTCQDADNDVLTFSNHQVDTNNQVIGDYSQNVIVSDGEEQITLNAAYLLFVAKLPGEPTISLVYGEGPFAHDSTSVDIQISTDIASECRYSLSGEYGFLSMYAELTPSNNGLTHDFTRGSLYKPKIFNSWIQCRSLAERVSTQTVTIITSVFELAPDGPTIPDDPNDDTPHFNNQTFNVSNQAIEIGQLSAANPEGGDLTFTLLEDSSGLFGLSSSGLLALANNKQLSFGSSYSLLAKATDNQNFDREAILTVNVVSQTINLAPRLLTKEFEVNENTKIVGQLAAIDPEGSAINYSIINDNAQMFNLTANGELSLKTTSSFDIEQQSLFSLDVQISDNLGNSTIDNVAVLVTDPSLTSNSVSIIESADRVIVDNGVGKITVWKSKFGLDVSQNDNALINALNSSINYRGVNISQLQAPDETLVGNNWVEVRGWYWRAPDVVNTSYGPSKSHENGLYYIVRYQFVAGKPFIQTAFTISDRHNDHPVEGHWDDMFKDQIIKDFVISIESAGTLDETEIVQNTVINGDITEKPGYITVNRRGNRWRHDELKRLTDINQITHLAELEDSDIQIVRRSGNEDNFLTVYPQYVGEIDLQLAQVPVQFAAYDLQITVNHSQGVSDLTVDQRNNTNDLGRFTLDENSSVVISSQSNGYARQNVFNRLHLIKEQKVIQVIKAQQFEGKLFDTGNIGLAVKDFWQKYPMTAKAKNNQLSIHSIANPTRLGPGYGLTVDFAINYDITKGFTSEAARNIYKAPEKSFPDWWHDFDGIVNNKVTNDSEYASIMNGTWDVIHGNDMADGNYGWKNYGDFKISNSYTVTNGDGSTHRQQDWGGMQYDLGLGLLLSWMYSDNEDLWARAQAGVRNSMDVQISKFDALAYKMSGAGLRKGDCGEHYSHWCQGPIPEFNYHTRSLLLYNHITGEQWPKDVAQMVIDNSAYFTVSRREWTAKSDRPLAWALHNLYYGAKAFPQGTAHLHNTNEWSTEEKMPIGSDYTEILNKLLVEYIKQFELAGNRLVGAQPVWQAQIVDGLIIVLEGGLVNPELEQDIRNIIYEAVTQLSANETRITEDGDYEMMYQRVDPNAYHPVDVDVWEDAKNYGFFWLNSLQWVEQQGTTLVHSSEGLYQWLVPQFAGKQSGTRQWSAVMSFPMNYVEKR